MGRAPVKIDYFDLLNAPAYSTAEAARLVRMHPWTVRRYLQGYEYEYIDNRTVRPPVVKSGNSNNTPFASFLDLIDLIFVREFMARGWKLPTLRKALDEARELLHTPHLARSVFFVSGGSQIVVELPKDGCLIALLTGGQLAMSHVIEMLSDKLDFENLTGYGFAKRWYPLGRKKPIVIDPGISFGKPALTGKTIPTSNIYDLYLGEGKKVEPVSRWFNISALEVNAAIYYERRLWQ